MSGEDDEKDFAGAIDGVKPLRGRDKLRPPPEAARRPPRRGGARRRSFVIERPGDDAFGRAEDVSQKQLAKLRTGRVEVERELDLHGMNASAAHRALHGAIDAARAEGVRCLLVIHGLGHHSRAGPVLKRRLPDWLQEDGVADSVLAFATAPPRQGGPGGTLVLLRRGRPQGVSSDS